VLRAHHGRVYLAKKLKGEVTRGGGTEGIDDTENKECVLARCFDAFVSLSR
jgi:hypothetical protein